MQYLSQSSNVFTRHRQRERRRVLAILAVVGGLALALLAWKPALAMQTVPTADDDAFQALVAPPGLLEHRIGEEAAQTYTVVGGDEVFEFERDGLEGSIRFLCRGGAPACPEGARDRQALSADQAGQGDLFFKSEAGVPVLRLTPTGGATLFGGADFVPGTIPPVGRAVIPAG